MVQPVLQPEIAQQLCGTLACGVTPQAAHHLRHHDVLERGEFRQQVMELIDEADVVAPDPRALDVAQTRGRRAVDIDLAGIGMFEEACDVQKRRFAGARRRHQRHRLSRPHRKLGAFENIERRVSLMELPADAVQEDERIFPFFGGGRRSLADRGGVVHRGLINHS